MAYAATSENYDDLDELGIEADETTEEFLKAADNIQKFVSQLDQQTLLKLYGYYKQATEGPCNTPRPSWYNMKGRAKWDAWDKLGKTTQNESKRLYIELVRSIDPDFAGSKERWVCVSTMQSNEKMLNESEKSIADYVKEGNSVQVVNILNSLNSGDVTEILNKLDDDGMGLIHWAADRGFSALIETLISYGANVNLRDADMQTALHYATGCGHLDCINVLLKSHADVNLEDDEGLKPKDISVDAKVRDLLTT